MNYPYPVKSITAQIKEVDIENRTVVGYFSTFNVKDADEDIIKPGAYTKTIQERGPQGRNRIMHLLQHDPTKPLGKPKRLEEDARGLLFETKITDTSYGTDVLKLYKDEVFNEHSVGINIEKSTWSEEDNANIVTSVKMWEGSTVTWGANEDTPVLGMKSLNKDSLLEQYNVLTKAFYRGDYTDDTFKLIKDHRNHLESLIKQAIESDETTPQPEPDGTTLDDIQKRFREYTLETKIKDLFTNG